MAAATALADVLAAVATPDQIESDYLWIISVEHPTFVGRGGELEAHVIVCRGREIAFDPGGDLTKRPPLDELVVTGFFTLSPIDPGRFVLR